MNYRHAFHAGGFVDVVKHLILTRIILYFQRKAAAFRVIDTHAGKRPVRPHRPRGRALARVARRDRAGAGQGAAAISPTPYLDAVRAFNPDGLATYPGSPVLVRHLLRPQDRLEAVELHPDDAAILKEEFAGDIQTRVIELDGWLALGAHVPPKEKRGLVLVDPPFEEDGEWERLVDGLVKAHKRFATGTLCALVSAQGAAGGRRLRHRAQGDRHPEDAADRADHPQALDAAAALRHRA